LTYRLKFKVVVGLEMVDSDEYAVNVSWEVREFIRAIKAYLKGARGNTITLTARKLVRMLGYSFYEEEAVWLRYKFARFLRYLERRHVVRRIGRSTSFVYVAEREKLRRLLEDYLCLAMLIEGK